MKKVKLKVKKKGQKPIEFKAGALRAQLGSKKGEPIPASKSFQSNQRFQCSQGLQTIRLGNAYLPEMKIDWRIVLR